MACRRFSWVLVCGIWIGCADGAAAQAQRAADDEFFATWLYPVMESAQCRLCHNDNGVASGTELAFPGEHANVEQITAFGLGLMDQVDPANPRQSLLLLKPTNREEHTGGERIVPGSANERLLLEWIDYLANLTAEQITEKREKIAAAQRYEFEPLTVRRLTHSQYNNTLRDLLDDQSQPARTFPKEDFIRGFRNQLEGQGISPLQAEAYSKAAERLAIAAFRGGDHLGLISQTPTAPTDPIAAERFVREFGLRAFRRPLTDSEVSLYAGLLEQEAGRSDNFFSGAKIVVEAMLQSPHFLFRIERGPGGPFEQYEIASRLSYFLWDTMPSPEMLEAARNGEYSTVEQIETAARRMLEDPRARGAMDEFLGQWMRFDRVLTATRDRRYRSFNSEVAAAMVEETRRLFNDLVWEDKNFMEFYSADYTFLSTDLAQVYGMPAPNEEFARVSYPTDSGRAGVLGHGSFLVVTSKPAETSPTERGLFVRNHFLAHEVPAPPPGVNTALPEVTEERPMTNRERLAIHLNSEACASCHRLIDPIGLGLEQYDPIGAFREQEVLQFGGFRRGRGQDGPPPVTLEIDTSAFIQGIENSEFSTPKELGRILTTSEASQRCIVKQLFRYAFGRLETTNDQPVIDGLLEEFRDSGFRFRELLVAMVTSPLFLQGGSISL